MRAFARVLFFVLLALVTWLTLAPDPGGPSGGMALTRWLAALLFGSARDADKIAHFLAYGTLGFVFALSGMRIMGARLAGVVMLVAYGGLLELAQGWFTLARTPDLLDAAANATGAGLAFFIGLATERVIGAARATKAFPGEV